MKGKINIAIIGCGGMGWTDIETMLDSEYVSSITGFEPNETRAKQTKDKFGIALTQNIDKIWDDKNIKLVYITSPGACHTEQAVAAMQAGKSVMLEKPMGISKRDLEMVLTAQKETGTFLQVGFECRYSKLYKRIKEIINSGEIGELKHVNFNYHMSPYPYSEYSWKNWKFTQKDAGGMFQEKLCHYVDLVRWWVGKPVVRFFSTKASNTIPYYQIPDNMQSTYEFKNGVISHLTFMMQVAESGNENLMSKKIDIADQVNDGHKLSYVLVGTEGALEASVFHRELRVFHHPGKKGLNGKAHMVRVEKWNKADDHFYFHNTTDQNLDIVRRVVQKLPPAIAPEDAGESMRLCFEMEDAAINGTWKIVER